MAGVSTPCRLSILPYLFYGFYSLYIIYPFYTKQTLKPTPRLCNTTLFRNFAIL